MHYLQVVSAMAGVCFFGLACASQQRSAKTVAEGQSYADAIRLLCDVDSKIAASEGKNELELGQLRDDYIVENTKNPDAIYFVTVWRTKSPMEQASLLEQAAAEQKLTDCALAKSLRGSNSGR